MVYLYFTFVGKILGHLYLFFTLPLFHFTFFPQLPNIYLYFALPLFLLPLFPYTRSQTLNRLRNWLLNWSDILWRPVGLKPNFSSTRSMSLASIWLTWYLSWRRSMLMNITAKSWISPVRVLALALTG